MGKRADPQGTEDDSDRDRANDAAPTDEDIVVPVVAESLTVGRQHRPGGAVRVRKRVRVRQAEVPATRQWEELVVERVPVEPPGGRVVDATPATRQDGATLVIPVVEEVLVTSRQLVLREEIRITRVPREAPVRQRATVRIEEVVVERQDAPGQPWRPMPLTSRSNDMQTVIGVFDNASDALRAADEIAQKGLDRSHIHLHAAGEQDIARTAPDAEAGSHWIGAGRGVSDRVDGNDASADAGGGGIMHRIGQFFGSLFGSSEDETDRSRADYYAEAVRRGSCVLSVDALDDSQALVASSEMTRCGAVDIDRRAEHWRSQGWSGFDASAPAYTQEQAMAERATYGAELAPPPSAGSLSPELHAGQDESASSGGTIRARATATGSASGEEVVPVVQEEMRVGKREVDRGGVRVIRRVIEQPVSETLELREERATIERRPVDRPAGAADLADTGERTYEVRETIEEPVVQKSARVVEEVVVGKQVSQRRETVDDTVRRTDVDIERLEGDATRASGALSGALDWSAAERNRRIEGSTWSGMPPIPQRRSTDRPSVGR